MVLAKIVTALLTLKMTMYWLKKWLLQKRYTILLWILGRKCLKQQNSMRTRLIYNVRP